MNEIEQIRQGDIFLIRNDVDISKLNQVASVKHTLAYGEKTGHSHVMQGDVRFFENRDGTIVCQVGSGKAELVHQEHEKIEIPEGDWKVVRQREFDIVEGIRRVSD